MLETLSAKYQPSSCPNKLRDKINKDKDGRHYKSNNNNRTAELGWSLQLIKPGNLPSWVFDQQHH